MMTDHIYPILEHPTSREAMIEPAKLCPHNPAMPEHVLFCFFREVVDAVCADGRAEVVARLRSEYDRGPIYVLESDFGRFAVIHPGVGSALSGMFLEQAIAYGGRKFVAVGGAGVLNSDIERGKLVIPTSAVRDEGTSYHYLPPGREVSPSAEAVAAIETTLNTHNVPYIKGKTWTTDGVYRETREKVERRRDQDGCLMVEMEAATFFAVAQFRQVMFGQILYGGDDLGGEEWDERDWVHGNASTREKLFWLGAEAVTRL